MREHDSSVVRVPCRVEPSSLAGCPKLGKGVMPNKGIAPLDPATPVGQVRQLVGATVFGPLDPPAEGFGDYEYFTDVEVEGFLTASSGSVLRAAGNALLQMSTGAALLAINAATEDLRAATESRAKDLRAVAEDYFKQADEADKATVEADSFFGVYDSVC